MLPSTSTNTRMTNTIKAEFLKGVFEREESIAFKRYAAASNTGTGYTYRPFDNDGLKISKRQTGLPSSRSGVLPSSRVAAPFRRSNQEYGSFYKDTHRKESGAEEPLSIHEQSIDQLDDRRKQMKAELAQVTQSLEEQQRMCQIAQKRNKLKAELLQIDEELVETQKEKEIRAQRAQLKEERDIRLRGGKFVDARNVPEYMATSLQIDHEANNRQDSTMAPPCFSAEYGSTHAYGGQVYKVFKPGAIGNKILANLSQK